MRLETQVEVFGRFTSFQFTTSSSTKLASLLPPYFATPLIGAAALLSGFTAALPRPDSAIGDEVAVSAPYGTILSDTAALAT